MNPFKFSGVIMKEDPISGCTFVHREHIVNSIKKFIQDGEYVQIVGPHQSGCTTLAVDLIDVFLQNNNPRPSYIPVLISCETLMDASREGFMRALIMRITRAIKENIEIKECPYIQSWLELKDKQLRTFLDLHLLLVTLGDTIRKTKAFSALVILVDEIEALPHDLVVDVLRFFRSLFGHYAERRWESPYFVITFTTHDLAYWKLGESSPYNISSVIHLAPFSRMELDTLLDNQHVGKELTNITFHETARKKIYEESGGHPYFIQRLCHIMVKRCYSDDDEMVALRSKDAVKAVMEIFEKGDKNLQNLYEEIPLDSEEWQLCRRLVAGYKEPYAANDPATKTLTELGIVRDMEHFCQISSGIYRRQILKRYTQKQYAKAIDSILENERLLLNISCLQEILIDIEIERLILDNIKKFIPFDNERIDEIVAEISNSLDRILKERKAVLDMDEIHIYTGYYNMERIKNQKEVILLLIKAFIGRFNEINTTE